MELLQAGDGAARGWGMLEVLDGSLIRVVNKLLAVIPMESQLTAWWDAERVEKWMS